MFVVHTGFSCVERFSPFSPHGGVERPRLLITLETPSSTRRLTHTNSGIDENDLAVLTCERWPEIAAKFDALV
jgi:hypothetical protein